MAIVATVVDVSDRKGKGFQLRRHRVEQLALVVVVFVLSLFYVVQVNEKGCDGSFARKGSSQARSNVEPSTTTTTTGSDGNDNRMVTGAVLVDIRTDGILGERVAPMVERIATLTDLPIELWISNTTEPISQLGVELMEKFGHRIDFRIMKQNHTYGEYVEDFQGAKGGHIGKAHALRESKFDIPMCIDTDVWLCTKDFVTTVQEAMVGNDVVWSLDVYAWGATKDQNDKYASPAIDEQLEEYKEFRERNSGTIVAVNRRKPAVQRWLQSAQDIFVQQKNLPEKILRKTFTDQAAFRESFFLHRKELSEFLVDQELACRELKAARTDGCLCECSDCLAIHGKAQFETCAQREGYW